MLDAYLASLLDAQRRGLADTNARVDLILSAEPVRVKLDHGVSIGVIVTELVSNAVKCAFEPGKSGRIEVTLALAADGFIVEVVDNGCGFDETAEAQGTGSRHAHRQGDGAKSARPPRAEARRVRNTLPADRRPDLSARAAPPASSSCSAHLMLGEAFGEERRQPARYASSPTHACPGLRNILSSFLRSLRVPFDSLNPRIDLGTFGLFFLAIRDLLAEPMIQPRLGFRPAPPPPR